LKRVFSELSFLLPAAFSDFVSCFSGQFSASGTLCKHVGCVSLSLALRVPFCMEILMALKRSASILFCLPYNSLSLNFAINGKVTESSWLHAKF
jgi:hypothetical protein